MRGLLALPPQCSWFWVSPGERGTIRAARRGHATRGATRGHAGPGSRNAVSAVGPGRSRRLGPVPLGAVQRLVLQAQSRPHRVVGPAEPDARCATERHDAYPVRRRGSIRTLPAAVHVQRPIPGRLRHDRGALSSAARMCVSQQLDARTIPVSVLARRQEVERLPARQRDHVVDRSAHVEDRRQPVLAPGGRRSAPEHCRRASLPRSTANGFGSTIRASRSPSRRSSSACSGPTIHTWTSCRPPTRIWRSRCATAPATIATFRITRKR